MSSHDIHPAPPRKCLGACFLAAAWAEEEWLVHPPPNPMTSASGQKASFQSTAQPHVPSTLIRHCHSSHHTRYFPGAASRTADDAKVIQPRRATPHHAISDVRQANIRPGTTRQ
ncbi:uncharacterized protein IWZ02DRAFT_435873 [Phyllosticta citriasiana]|uniref:uncharacterized protein n=1 Tax=Phyllosticta citriasiana TaxID=595635 RepID=UPI0030FD8530